MFSRKASYGYYCNLVGAWLCLVSCWLIASSARADFVLEFGQGGIASNQFSIGTVGGTQEIEVYLRETASTSLFAIEGLSFARFSLSYDESIAKVLSDADVSVPGYFDNYGLPDTATNPNSLDLSANNPIFSARILLGTFKFTGIAVGTTTLTLTDFSVDDDFLTGLDTVLDSSLVGSTASLTLTAVPEPSLLLGIVLIVFLFVSHWLVPIVALRCAKIERLSPAV